MDDCQLTVTLVEFRWLANYSLQSHQVFCNSEPWQRLEMMNLHPYFLPNFSHGLPTYTHRAQKQHAELSGLACDNVNTTYSTDQELH